MATKRRRSDRAGRGKLSSPGRPPVARREDVAGFWAAIALGRSSEDAAADVGVSMPVGSRWFRRSGGMPPTHLSVSAEPLSGRYLSFAEREEVALLRVQGHGMRHIARALNRAPSTISRELRRNAATRSGSLEYRATTAQWHSDRSARRPKTAKLAANAALQYYVQDRLAGLITRPDGMPSMDRASPGRAAGMGRTSTDDGSGHEAPSRSRADCASTSPRTGPGGSVTGRSISGSTSRAAEPCSELSACLRPGRALRVPRARSAGRASPL